MNLDEFEYMVSNAQVSVGKTICFYTSHGGQIVGTISKLARFGQRVIGAELCTEEPQINEFTVSNLAGEVVAVEKIPVIGEPPELKPVMTVSTVFVPASTVIAAEWAA